MSWLKTLPLTLINFLRHHPGLLALFGFFSGLASFVLIERNESVAQMIAIMMLVSWVWLVLEQTLRQGVLSRFGIEVPAGLIHFFTQMVHQESFFFVLPFFLAATHWHTGQGWVTGLLATCALISVIDPLYYRLLAPRRALLVMFHALALFATLLVSLPIILPLTTSESFVVALLVALLLTLPSLKAMLPQGWFWRIPALSLLLIGLASATWQLRAYVPGVPLRLAEVFVTDRVDREQRQPSAPLKQVSASSVLWDGLYAWTAIRVPRGLHEMVYHLWLHNGEEVDRIALDVHGGREQGYRAWSHKLNFPSDPSGDWTVKVVTGTGQMIGMIRFTVVADELSDVMLEQLSH